MHLQAMSSNYFLKGFISPFLLSLEEEHPKLQACIYIY